MQSELVKNKVEKKALRAPGDGISAGGSWIYRRFLAPVLRINDTPRALALGVALGVFIAMTPTVGVQMLLVVVIHTLVGANRLAGIVMVYISNPFTLVPIYWLDYVVGSFLLGRELCSYADFSAHVGSVARLAGRWEFWAATKELFSLGGDLAIPTFLGGIVVGLILAVPAYPLMLGAVRRHRRRHGKEDAEGSDGGKS